jgi:type I restriction enzyme S subunit
MSFPKYEAYKDSGVEWLGEVPDHWGVMALKYVTSMKGRIGFRGYTTEDIVAEGDGAITLSPSNMVHGELDFSKATYISWGKYHESPEIQLSLGDTVIVKTGSTYGRVAFVQDLPLEATVNPQIAIFKTELIDKKFLFFLVSSKYFHALARNSNTGSTMPTMTQESVLSFLIALPSWKEQTQIARFLDHETARIDALIAEQQRLIELLKEKRQAVISHAVTKGLDPTTPMKDSGVAQLGSIPNRWMVSRLGYESWVRARLGWKGLKAEEYVDEGYIFLSTPNIKGQNIDFENVNYISQIRFDESPEIKLREGDVLLVKDGSTLGIVNFVRTLPGSATVNSSIAVITPNDRLDGLYLKYLFESTFLQNTIQSVKGGMGVPHLFQSDLNKFYIPLPEIEEQGKIASFLDSETARVDALVAQAEEGTALLQERRSALISAAVTGKIDVRGWQAPTSAAPAPTLVPLRGIKN